VEHGLSSTAMVEAEVLELDEDLRSFENDELVKAALAKGVDLRKYAKSVDDELRQVERDSIMDYIHEAEELATLHTQIKQCDGILDNMESMLSGFQGDLASISAEIKHLQDESISINIRLRNRKAVEGQLSDFITQAVIPPALVTNICAAEVNETYLEYVTELNSKVRFAKQEGAQRTMAYRDISTDIEKLRLRAAQRMRDFLLQKIGTLRKRMTNVQILQQAVLLKFKSFYAFLLEHAPEKAAEVLEAYNTTMSAIFLRHFRAHLSDLVKCRVDHASRAIVIGEEIESVASLFSKSAAKGEGAFKLGERGHVLDAMHTPIIPAIAMRQGASVYEEEIWSSTCTLLVDTVCSEHSFCVDFFGGTGASGNCENVFGKTLIHLLEHLEAYIGGTYDSIGLLLLLKISGAHDSLMLLRGVGGLGEFFSHVCKLLWERFYALLEHQTASITKTGNPLPTSLDVHPLPVVRRYAEYCASLQQLASGNVEQHVNRALTTLRAAMHTLLVARLGQVLRGSRKKQAIFLINNCDVVLGTLRDNGVGGEDTRMFEELLENNKGVFVEEVLAAPYGRLIRFVKTTEQPLATGGEAAVKSLDEYRQLEPIVKEFHANWKRGIEEINVEVLKSFANFKNGMEILKQTLTQLLLYHTRFLDIVKQLHPDGSSSFAKYMITISTIMTEIKTYSRNY